MPREVFIAGQILTAAEMNSVSDQTVMVFAGTAARGSAIPTPSEGMVTYLSDSNLVEAYTGSAFKPVAGVLQVVSTTKTDSFAMSSSTFADITGLTATITPSSTTSKIYVSVSLVAGMNINNTATIFQLLRDSTAIGIGDAAGSRTRGTTGAYSASLAEVVPVAMSFLDSPSATSATTYKVQIKSSVNGQQSTINRSNTDSDAGNILRGTSTITLFEVAG